MSFQKRLSFITVSLVIEFVAHAVHRQNIRRVARLVAQFLPQILDVHVDAALVAFVGFALRGIEQIHARESAARL